MANFWQSLKNNWNNGNFLKWTNFGANVGMSAIATYGVMDSVFSGKSPFGCGWGYSGCCNSLYPNLGAINTIMQRNAWNPIGIVNDPMAQMMLGNNSMLGMSSMMGMPSMMGFPDMMSGGMPWMNGGMPWMNGSMNYGNYPFTTFNYSSTNNNKKEDKVDIEYTKYNNSPVAFDKVKESTDPKNTEGQTLSDSLDSIIKLVDGEEKLTREDIELTNNQDISAGIKDAAKNLGIYMDNDASADGFVSSAEFSKYFEAGNSDVTNEQKAEFFKVLDLNNDNKLDANELAAMLYHIDSSNTSGTNDGKINGQEYKSWITKMTDNSEDGRSAMQSAYKKLFGK